MSTTAAPHRSTSALVRRRVETGGERLWRHEDFASLPPQAVGQALSRLSRSGELRRLSKGVYYRPRKTSFGDSRPNPVMLRELATVHADVFPSGVAAAALLGFTTQNPARPELATTARSLPRKLVGESALVRTRRPRAWSALSREDAAFLELLRDGARASALPRRETALRLLTLLREDGRLERLLRVAPTEPPRVRAMLGALGEELGAEQRLLQRLHASLNPLSRYEFGPLAELKCAGRWRAKERRQG